MAKIREEEPRLIIGTTNTDHYKPMSTFEKALHPNYLWKIARNQAASGRTFLISHENNLDDGLSKGLQELYSLEDVEFLPVTQCERGIMETFRTSTCPQCSMCSQEILDDQRRRQCPRCEQWVHASCWCCHECPGDIATDPVSPPQGIFTNMADFLQAIRYETKRESRRHDANFSELEGRTTRGNALCPSCQICCQAHV